jgi:hypothetical protein
MGADRDKKILARLRAELGAELAGGEAEFRDWLAAPSLGLFPEQQVIVPSPASLSSCGASFVWRLAYNATQPPSARKRARVPYVNDDLAGLAANRFWLDIVRRVRVLYKEEYGKARGNEKRVVKIAAAFLVGSDDPCKIGEAVKKIQELKKRHRVRPPPEQTVNIKRPASPRTANEAAQLRTAVERAARLSRASAALSRASKKP